MKVALLYDGFISQTKTKTIISLECVEQKSTFFFIFITYDKQSS